MSNSTVDIVVGLPELSYFSMRDIVHELVWLILLCSMAASLSSFCSTNLHKFKSTWAFERQKAKPRVWDSSLCKRTIFIRDLTYATTEKELFVFISRVAPPEDWLICKFPDTGRGRGFAFVQMESVETMHTVIRKLNNDSLNGRNVKLEMSTNAITRSK
eukprot:GEMP01084687.1.p1 GENE.GEMP01084687.1~~GEMP01084687.1.p1  ORF type:complete len:159 (+),score=18.37 GEMP01084687.1:439-915(+)